MDRVAVGFEAESVAGLNIFVPEGGEADQKAIDQIINVLEDERAVAGALMADHREEEM